MKLTPTPPPVTVPRKQVRAIRALSCHAAKLRMAGKVEEAQTHEAMVDGWVARAEIDGWGSEAFEAEIDGQANAVSVVDAALKANLRAGWVA